MKALNVSTAIFVTSFTRENQKIEGRKKKDHRKKGQALSQSLDVYTRVAVIMTIFPLETFFAVVVIVAILIVLVVVIVIVLDVLVVVALVVIALSMNDRHPRAPQPH